MRCCKFYRILGKGRLLMSRLGRRSLIFTIISRLIPVAGFSTPIRALQALHVLKAPAGGGEENVRSRLPHGTQIASLTRKLTEIGKAVAK